MATVPGLHGSRSERIGISLSGGGIRAAAFGLGALQALQAERGLVKGPRHADDLSAVSGGSYTAGALVMLNAQYGGPPSVGGSFAEGSPEVEHVRRHARYLLGGGMWLETVLQVLARLVINLGFLAALVFVPARVTGWLLGAAVTSLRSADQVTPPPEVGPLRWLTAAAVVLAVVGALAHLVMVFSRSSLHTPSVQRGATLVVLAAGALAVLGVALPLSVDAALHAPGHGRHFTWGSALSTSSAAAVASLTAAAVAVRARVKLVTGLYSRLRWLRRAGSVLAEGVSNVVLMLAVPLAAYAFFVAMVLAGATNVPWVESDHAAGELALWGTVALALGLVLALGDCVTWSLHPFYKRRLMSCFCLRASGSPPVVAERSYSERYLLSQSYADDLPELVVCAAANVSGFGKAPAGQNVLPWVFTRSHVGFSCDEGKQFATAALEESLRRSDSRPWRNNARNLTLPAAVAMTGAAVSPTMGKQTRAPLRAVLGLLNLRLGVWMPNPACDAVLARVRDGGSLHGWPRPTWLLREMQGRNVYDHEFVYVSDGGHYENLGLVELLRRRCTEVWAVDASGDPAGGTGALTEAMRLAEAELGLRWTDTADLALLRLDAQESATRRAPTLRRTYARLAYVLPAAGTEPERPGVVTVVKIGVSAATPLEVADYQQRHRGFPYDSTGNQLYRADRFDAYRELGLASTRAALQHDEEERAQLARKELVIDLTKREVAPVPPQGRPEHHPDGDRPASSSTPLLVGVLTRLAERARSQNGHGAPVRRD